MAHPFAPRTPCDALRLTELLPRGGPRAGGTFILVRSSEDGPGFIDLGDTKCAFGSLELVAEELAEKRPALKLEH